MRRLVTVFTAVLLMGPVLAACGEGDESSTGDGAKGLGDDYSVASALRELPDSSEPAPGRSLQVLTGDLARASELASLPEPTDDASTAQWGLGLTKAPLSLPLAQDLGMQRLATGAMRKTLGFDARDVLTYAAVESVPENILVMRLADDATPKKDLTTTGDGEIGGMDREAGPESPFPFVLGVAHHDDRVALGRRADVLEDWKKGPDSTLADHEALLDVAEALDEHDVYGAHLVDGVGRRPPVSPQQLAEAAHMPEFSAVGVGEAVEDGVSVEYVAYRVDDADRAAPEIEKVWRDGVSLQSRAPLSGLVSVEKVTADDNTVVVQLTPLKRVGVAQMMLHRSDVPFIVAQ